VRRPRVRDLNERFVSRVLPLFKRKTKEVGELLPQLYLRGLALGDFELALRGLLGEGAPLSLASLLRLKAQWQGEYETWKQRRLDDLEVVYLWADGLYVKAGLEDTKAAMLVMIGVLTNGQKVVVAVESGQRESKESWGMILRDLRTTAAKRFKKVENATALIWEMLQVAESTFRRLKGAELLPAVYAGTRYVDGIARTLHARPPLAA
jgi:putative transposase